LYCAAQSYLRKENRYETFPALYPSAQLIFLIATRFLFLSLSFCVPLLSCLSGSTGLGDGGAELGGDAEAELGGDAEAELGGDAQAELGGDAEAN
jgi:hypothetical protein